MNNSNIVFDKDAEISKLLEIIDSQQAEIEMLNIRIQNALFYIDLLRGEKSNEIK